MLTYYLFTYTRVKYKADNRYSVFRKVFSKNLGKVRKPDNGKGADRMEQWVPLLGYPGYSVSDMGRVRNDKMERMLTPVKLPSSHSIVGLSKGGVHVKRSVSRLVIETFVQRPANVSFNTPIHLDGDLFNCSAENLDWRPRWFAQKHTMQFRREQPPYPDPIREVKTGEAFENCWMAVFHYGLLYMDLVLSITNKTYVFPTMQSYEWA